ncbi:MAG TPA: hypothetical protein PKW42_12095 [bacterium]|nr:hypothetical protein [bacterium]HPP13460.1 hypothetical protein [bacterium]
MNEKGSEFKKNVLIVSAVLGLNFVVITCSIFSGIQLGNPALRFEENQTVTFLSALLLGLTGWSALMTYFLRRRLQPESGQRFWLLSSLGFFYLCLDEYFMAHEGIDDFIASLLKGQPVRSEMDGLTIGAFGVIALVICWNFRKEILSHASFLLFLVLGGFCLAGTVFFDLFKQLDVRAEVVEESFKFLGVSFFFAAYSRVLFSEINR